MTEQEINPFRGARKHLHQYGFICIALGKAAKLKEITFEARDRAKGRVHQLLQGEATLEGWLSEYVPEFDVERDLVGFEDLQEKIQTTRLAWCDWLADEWDKGVRE